MSPPFSQKTVSHWNAGHPSIESYPLRLGQATWLIPCGLHSCETAPDSNRTSLLRSERPQRFVLPEAYSPPSYTPQMDKKKLSLALTAATAAAAVALARRRPVKPPHHHGAWKPHGK